MQASRDPHQLSANQRSPSAEFSVVIVYEDFVTGMRAQKGCDFLAEEFGQGCEFKHSLWRSDLLKYPQLKASITGKVAEADLVIISVHGDLPAGVGSLVDVWLAEKEYRDNVLLTVFDRLETHSLPRVSASARLALLARRHGLDFFEELIGEGDQEGDQDQPAVGLKLVWVF